MRSFDELVAEAASAEVGWDFGWLAGRATEERPPWGYGRRLARSLASVDAALDIETGTGQLIAEAPALPRRMVVTEGWAPNVAQARAVLEPRGVVVVDTSDLGPDDRLPLDDATFELVSARHPVRPPWSEIHRLLRSGGAYLGQHVGPGSAFELIERFVGPLDSATTSRRDPQLEVQEAQATGLTVTNLQTARCRLTFLDIGAVVYTLRTCIWWVPDFDVRRYDSELRALDAEIRETGAFVAHSTRHLVEAARRD